MIPRRRSRFVLIAAFIITVLLYNGWGSSSLNTQPYLQHSAAPASAPGSASPASPANKIENDGLKPIPAPPAAPAPAAQAPAKSSYQEATEKTNPHSPPHPNSGTGTGAGVATPNEKTKANGNAFEIPTLKDAASPNHQVDLSLPENAPKPNTPVVLYDPVTGTTKGTLPEAIPDLHERPPPPNAVIEPAVASTQIHWSKVPEHFPVPTESIIHMPTGAPKAIPKIQFDFPKVEDAAAKAKRQERQQAIVAEMKHAWSGYRTYAWMHDELAPNTKAFKDPFCGWAATLVDALDTLWIMGLKEQFDEAAKAVRDIDFTYTPQRRDIPVFETIIRYLGGLLSAYDVSGGAKGDYPMLLEKAIELAEILMGVFDTPNRMPILYYQWQPDAASQPHRAGAVGVAELGSMSMEFTRLAQLTGKQKYYDAIARITNEFEGLQNRGTALDGLFPEHLDASGCNRTATAERNRLAAEQEKPPVGFQPQGQAQGKAESSSGTELHKRSPPGAYRHAHQNSDEWDCVPQPVIPASASGQSFSLGGSQDSTYEYFPKQFLLLGGLEPKYETMHRKVMEGSKKYLLYRPMINDTSKVLFTAKAMTIGSENAKYRLDYEVTHLSCFVGGMFGMGAKIFNDPEDLEIAIQLTEGCVWSYRSTPSGIMPESAQVVPCDNLTVCAWNESKWWDTLDGSGEWRDGQLASWETKKAKFLETFVPSVPLQTATPVMEDVAGAVAVPAVGAVPTEAPSGDVSSVGTVPKNNASAPIGARAVDTPTGTTTTSAMPEDPTTVLANNLRVEPGLYDYDTMVAMMAQIGRRPMTHEEAVIDKLAREKLPPGYSLVDGKRYILRPEAIESVWYMYRITGDPTWMDKGWTMWQAVISHVKTEYGHSALDNILESKPEQLDGMESFWLAETLKYFYLLFAETDVISLDEWVLNTEAHPFKRPTAAFGNGEQAVKL